jgi:hypothetical protein
MLGGNIFAQGESPNTSINLTGKNYSLQKLTKGKCYYDSSYSFRSCDSTTQFTKGFCFWFYLDCTKDTTINFFINSLDTKNNYPGSGYLELIAFKFNGTGEELFKSINENTISPIRVCSRNKLNIQNNVKLSGLSYFEVDTIPNSDWRTGFAKQIIAKKGERYYFAVQVPVPCDSPFGTKLLIAPEFEIGFNPFFPFNTFRGQFFDNNNKLTEDGKDILKIMAKYLEHNPYRVVMTFHYDEMEDSSVCFKNSKSRVMQVEKEMKLNKVQVDKYTLIAVGNRSKVARIKNPQSGMNPNTRIDVVFKKTPSK